MSEINVPQDLQPLSWLRKGADVATASAVEGVFEIRRHFDGNCSLSVPWSEGEFSPKGTLSVAYSGDVKALMKSAEMHRQLSTHMKKIRGEAS